MEEIEFTEAPVEPELALPTASIEQVSPHEPTSESLQEENLDIAPTQKLEISTDLVDRPITDSPLVPVAPTTDVSESVRELVSKFSGLPYKDPDEDEIVYPDDDSAVEEVADGKSKASRGDLKVSKVDIVNVRASVSKLGKSRDSITIVKSRDSIAKSNSNIQPFGRSNAAVIKSRDSNSNIQPFGRSNAAVIKSRDSINKSNSNIQPFGRSNAINKSKESMADKKSADVVAKSRESIAERTSIVLQAIESTKNEEAVKSSRESIVEPKLLKSSYVSIHEKRKSTQSIAKSTKGGSPTGKSGSDKKISRKEASRKKIEAVDSSSEEEILKPLAKTSTKRNKPRSVSPEESVSVKKASKSSLLKPIAPKRSANKNVEQVSLSDLLPIG
jgi:hypothetical protein